MNLGVKTSIVLSLYLLVCIQCFGQNMANFCTLSQAAVYLFEKGDNYFEVRQDYTWLITEYHAKIKVLLLKIFFRK